MRNTNWTKTGVNAPNTNDKNKHFCFFHKLGECGNNHPFVGMNLVDKLYRKSVSVYPSILV